MKYLLVTFLLLLYSGVAGASLNNPYPASESGQEIYYGSFSERPKHLDPAIAYSSDEYAFICQIYEPVVQYHYLRRPYELIPLTAEEMPSCSYYDKDGRLLGADVSPDKVAKAVWTIKIKKGIMYQDHPCFVQDYHHLGPDEAKGIRTLFDFEQTGTRELKAADYVYQIKRLADMRNRCPIFAPVVAEYIVGMKEYAKEIDRRISKIREERGEKAGIFYNREEDEKKNPIVIDYHSIPCEGLKIVDDYTYQITLNRKYPQFIYWLSMPFFAPMPEEAVLFYNQGEMISRNIILDWYPVGTGAYRIQEFEPNRRIVLTENENYHDEYYPDQGEEDDLRNGLLEAKGKRLPLVKKAVYSVEKETTPFWNKFLQGYYDISGISSENFSRVIDLGSSGVRLSGPMKKRGIRLITSIDTTIIYLGFNMTDSIIGGLDEKKCKLRQALSIALNREEFIQIFSNGRGIAAQGPIPPGIFGFKSGKEGVNRYTHSWDEKKKRAVRKGIEEAKKLLAEAGYPNGIGPDGKKLVIFYDTVSSPGSATYFDWLKKQFAQINVMLEIRETDYNRFREKMNTGQYQVFGWGWNADYPDPENFLFLLYGPNSKVKFHGENAANYSNPEYDRLFEKMNNMENSPERMEIISQMVEILKYDCPWEWGYYPIVFALYHKWVSNIKPHKMANNTLKYRQMDVEGRNLYRQEQNKPKLWVASLIILLLAGIAIPGIIVVLKREK